MQKNRFRPRLEVLEDRSVPSTLSVTAFNQMGTPNHPHWFHVEGYISSIAGYDNGGTLNNRPINVGGVSSGTMYTDATGYFFSNALEASALGTVTFRYNGPDMSNQVSENLINSAPAVTISNAVWDAATSSYTFSGSVTDEWASGLTVTLNTNGALPAIDGTTAIVQSNGTWSVRVSGLTYHPQVWVFASTTDWWGSSGQSQGYYI